MEFFDSHCHLNDEKFKGEVENIINNAHENGVNYMTNIGVDDKTSIEVFMQALHKDNIYCAIGQYPEYCNDDELDLSFIKKLIEIEDVHIQSGTINEKKIVAIGEIGLDYHGENVNKENQIKHFIEQIKLANELNLPIAIHSRNADMDMLEVLKNNKVSKGFLMHCFSSCLEVAKEVIKLGGYISLAGPVTFKNAKGLIDVAKFVPLDRIMVETDSPYLCPEPKRGQRNEPANVYFTAQKVADIKEMSLEEFAKHATENAKKFYNII